MNSSAGQYSPTEFKKGVPLFYGGLITNGTGEYELMKSGIVSNTIYLYFKIIVKIAISGGISIVGIVANIVNIIVFIRQGIFTDSGTAGLLGLTVSDLLCVASMLWLSVSFSIGIADPPGLSWNPWAITYLTAGWPHLICAQITRVVTAYIAFERCICVVFPFKVKVLFTPRRSITIIAAIFMFFGLAYSPVFITQQLKSRHDPKTNTTRLVLVSCPEWRLITDIMLYVNSMTLNICSVAVVLVCTVITVSRVNLSKAWRESLARESSPQASNKNNNCVETSMTTKASQDSLSKQKTKPRSNKEKMPKSKMLREQRLVRMVVLISLLFLICYIPHATYLLMFAINPEIRITRRYENLAQVMYAFTFLMETSNSSVNIIIYYKMSSRYKQELIRLFGWDKN